MAFDLVTHKRNKKGKIIEINPYQLRISKQGMRYERAGKFYSPNGEEMPADLAAKFEKAKPVEAKAPEVKLEAKPEAKAPAPKAEEPKAVKPKEKSGASKNK